MSVHRHVPCQELGWVPSLRLRPWRSVSRFLHQKENATNSGGRCSRRPGAAGAGGGCGNRRGQREPGGAARTGRGWREPRSELLGISVPASSFAAWTSQASHRGHTSPTLTSVPWLRTTWRCASNGPPNVQCVLLSGGDLARPPKVMDHTCSGKALRTTCSGA